MRPFDPDPVTQWKSRRRGGAVAALSLCACIGLVASGDRADAQSQPAAKNVTLLGIQSATVAPHGLAFGVISLTNKGVENASREEDGSLGFGVGVGNAQTGVGLQFSAQITSLSDDFADSGFLEVKAARQIVGGTTPTFIAASIDGAGWGDSSDRDTGGAVMVTSLRQVRFSESGEFYPIMFTLGVGTNERNNGDDPGFFGGLGIGLTPNVGISAAWGGDAVNLGASFRFDQVDNLGVTATLFDAFDQEDSRRISVSVSYFLTDLF